MHNIMLHNLAHSRSFGNAAAAVNALSLVAPEFAWLEDPAPPQQAAAIRPAAAPASYLRQQQKSVAAAAGSDAMDEGDGGGRGGAPETDAGVASSNVVDPIFS